MKNLGKITLFLAVTYKFKKLDADNTFIEVVKQTSKEIVIKALFLLLSWGLAFLSYAIIT